MGFEVQTHWQLRIQDGHKVLMKIYIFVFHVADIFLYSVVDYYLFYAAINNISQTGV